MTQQNIAAAVAKWPRMFVVAVCAFAIVPGVASAQDNIQIQEILKEWDARQKRTKTLRLEWTEDFIETKGSLTKQIPSRVGKGIVPPADSRFQNSGELVLDEGKIRFRYRCHVWCSSKQAYVDDDALHVFDGKAGKQLTVGGTIDYPFGIITNEKKSSNRTLLVLRPILVTFRPIDPDLSPYGGMPYVTTGNHAVIQNRVCTEVEVRRNIKGSVNRLWIDPERGHTVTRITNSENEKLRLKIDVRYRRDQQQNWIPESWEISTYLSDGSLNRSIRANVSAIAINPSVSKRDFDIEWPVGTYVKNEKQGPDFIQMDNGNVRVVSEREKTLPYATLVSTPEPVPRQLLSWPVLTCAAVLMVTGAYLIYRMWTRRRARVA